MDEGILLRAGVFHHTDFITSSLREQKLSSGASIDIVVPAKNESATIGQIVETLVHFRTREHLVDNIIVIDSNSDDDTAKVAETSGAEVVRQSQVAANRGDNQGKGEALWKSLFVSNSDIIIFLDGDLRDFDIAYVTGLVGPLLLTANIQMVKPIYRRPIDSEDHSEMGQGGRVNELVARPILSIVRPELASIAQPLGGEFAVRTQALRTLPFITGYGVDIGLLIDIFDQFGRQAIAEVVLPDRQHRHHDLRTLGRMSHEILRVALNRSSSSDLLQASNLQPSPRYAGDYPAEERGAFHNDHRLTEIRTRPPQVRAEESSRIFRAKAPKHDAQDSALLPRLMGILNVNSDSFSSCDVSTSCIDDGLRLLAGGADIVDVGAESASPATPVTDPVAERELLVPVIQAMASRVTVSVDTYKPDVAAASLNAGAQIVNDYSGLSDPTIAGVCADYGAQLVVTHNPVGAKVKLLDRDAYIDLFSEIAVWFETVCAKAEEQGLARESLILDPGVDLAKTPAQTIQTLRFARHLAQIAPQCLYAVSRKDFIGALTGTRPSDRGPGTLAAVEHLIGVPNTIVRVHDVAGTRQFLTTWVALGERYSVPPGLSLPTLLRREI